MDFWRILVTVFCHFGMRYSYFSWLVSLLVGSLFWIIWYSATPAGSALQADLTFASLITVFVQVRIVAKLTSTFNLGRFSTTELVGPR